MRIMVEIGHPAHVHTFKNLIWKLQKEGHQIVIATADKDIAIQLLEKYGFEYTVIYVNKKQNLLSKLLMLISGTYRMTLLSLKFRPDIYISRLSPVSSIVSRIFRKKHICFDDTEHATVTLAIARPFSDVIITPDCYRNNLGAKHIKVNSYKELAYLHPNYFKPDPSVLIELGLKEGEVFTLMRFVSWGAIHDGGSAGLTIETKRKAIKRFEKYGRVFITSESPLPEEFEKYRVNLSPEKMHHLQYYATLLYGESATMASECAVIGTHAIFCDDEGRGYTDDEEKYGLVYNYKLDHESQNRSIIKADELLSNKNTKQDGKMKGEKLLQEKGNLTDYLVDIIEKEFVSN